MGLEGFLKGILKGIYRVSEFLKGFLKAKGDLRIGFRVEGLLGGSWGFVTIGIEKVTIAINTHNSN